MRRGHCGKRDNRVTEPEYWSWVRMHRRCYEPKYKGYKNYGGRGITICDRWKDYRTFLADVGRKPSPDLSLDRIDNDGNYEPGNVRWATHQQQAANRSIANRITYKGRTMCAAEWARELGMSGSVLRARINVLKWPLERAMQP